MKATRVRETATVAGPRAMSPGHVRGEGRVARAARGVLVSSQSRLASTGTRVCGRLLDLHRPEPESARAARGVLVLSQSRLASAGTHMCGRMRALHRSEPGREGRVARAARGVLVSSRSRRASGVARECGLMRALHRPEPGGKVASRERHWACLSRRSRNSHLRSYACAAGCGPSAGRSRGGKVA